jgi:Arc/MetJ family transcription regulator
MMYNSTPAKRETTAMRTTLNIDEDLLDQAQRMTGIQEKAALVREGLRALIERESARRLAKLGGSAPDLRPVPRRRTGPA